MICNIFLNANKYVMNSVFYYILYSNVYSYTLSSVVLDLILVPVLMSPAVYKYMWMHVTVYIHNI